MRAGPAVAGGGAGIVILALVALVLGVDPRVLLEGGAALAPEGSGPPPAGDEMVDFVSAAAAIGDDRLQRRARGYVVPESFTHGSSERRVRWFRAGLAAGDFERCDTFSARSL